MSLNVLTISFYFKNQTIHKASWKPILKDELELKGILSHTRDWHISN